MSRCGFAILLVSALALLVLDPQPNPCRGAPEGHGGGAGHGPALVGRYGFHGHYGGYGRYHHWGYPAFGVGFGLGCALGYPYYYYDGYVPVYANPVYYGPRVEGPPPAGPTPPVPLTDANVLFSVHVLPDAVVWFNGFKTNQTGPRREFTSSGLAPGQTYTFDIRAQWTGPDGKVVDVDRRLSVQGGERRTVDFLSATVAGNVAP